MKKLIGLIVSFGILAVIYRRVDPVRILEALEATAMPPFLGALGLILVTLGMTATRLSMLAPLATPVAFAGAIRLTLMASVLNLVLPSKMGDIAKAHALNRENRLTGAEALALVVFEKAWDLCALLLIGTLALPFVAISAPALWPAWPVLSGLFALTAAMLASRSGGRAILGRFARLPGRAGGKFADLAGAWDATLSRFWARPGPALAMIGLSVAIWLIHLLQIWLFAQALSPAVPLLEALARAPLAILFGLLPFTFAGIGTRDAALIVLFSPFMTAAAGAGLGIYCTLRYVIPALLGLPFLYRYLQGAPAARIAS